MAQAICLACCFCCPSFLQRTTDTTLWYRLQFQYLLQIRSIGTSEHQKIVSEVINRKTGLPATDHTEPIFYYPIHHLRDREISLVFFHYSDLPMISSPTTRSNIKPDITRSCSTFCNLTLLCTRLIRSSCPVDLP